MSEFVKDLIKEIRSKIAITKKEYMPLDGQLARKMSCCLACELSNVIAAIGIVAGLEYFENCPSTRSVFDNCISWYSRPRGFLLRSTRCIIQLGEKGMPVSTAKTRKIWRGCTPNSPMAIAETMLKWFSIGLTRWGMHGQVLYTPIMLEKLIEI